MPDYTPQLRSLMQPLGFTSFRSLSRAAGCSDWQLEQLRKGQVLQLRVETLTKLSQVFQKPIGELLAIFSEAPAAVPTPPTQISPLDSEPLPLQREYQRLQTQLAQQQEALQQEFQQVSLQILESWLLQFPTAAYAAQQNPQVPAVRLLPLLRPIEQLLQSWGIELLEPVGAEVAFDPQCHQLMEGTASPGVLVKIRYAGYRQGDKLLYRAKVSLVPAYEEAH